MASADQISCRNVGRRSWASAPTGRRASHINHPGQRRTAKRLRQRVRENGWESRQRSPQKGPATPDNPSVSLRLTAPFAQGSLRDGGCGLPRRPCGPPRNDNRFLSFRGAERRGNPSFLRWTGVRAAEVVGPYGRSTEVPATGRCRHRPLRKAQSTTQASRRAAKRPRPQPRGMGGNRRKDHPKRGTAPATARAALSEAESAERAAGQIRSLPDTLKVQHGVQGPEVSAKPRPCSRRGCVH